MKAIVYTKYGTPPASPSLVLCEGMRGLTNERPIVGDQTRKLAHNTTDGRA